MIRYLKLIIIPLLILIYSISQGQEKSSIINQDVFIYLTNSGNKTKKNKHFPLTLLIDNHSRDTIAINNFSKNIFHKLDYTKANKVFYWDFLTTSNQVPQDLLIITGTKPENVINGENESIVIPPNSIYVTEIFIKHSQFIKYGKGFYKLCLYYEKSSKCIAELIVKIE